MNCEAVLRTFHAAFGGHLNGPYSHKSGPRWVWTAHGDDVGRVLEELLPLLIEKRLQAEAALQFLRGRPQGGYTEAEEARRAKLFRTIRALKGRK